MSRILIVDDEESIRLTLKAFLVKDGHQVEVSPDAESGLLKVGEADFDIILTDIIMPRMTGIEFLNKIREADQMVQVIIMTGEPTVETAVDAVKQGANDYIAKPVDKAALLKVISKAAQISQLQNEKLKLEAERSDYLKTLESTVARRTKELQEALHGTVLMFSSLIEIRDPYTAGHQLRVGNLAAAIALKMGQPQNIADQLRITGYLHDIGKIMVPAEILTKPGRLNEFEMGLIRMHSQKGYEIVCRSKLPENIAKIIYQHHERLDGSGYPNGLKQGQICLEACILIVADVVEAMMSFRPYRPALGLDAAIEEISMHSGTRYQHDIVDACISLFRDGNYQLEDNEQLPLF